VENFDEEPTNRDEDYLSSAKARENDDQNGDLRVLLLCFTTLSFTSFFPIVYRKCGSCSIWGEKEYLWPC
jgi:hypothetical protein